MVEHRTRVGDFEFDTMYGKNNIASILIMVERASRHVRIDILANRMARVIGAVLVGNLTLLKDRVLTLIEQCHT